MLEDRDKWRDRDMSDYVRIKDKWIDNLDYVRSIDNWRDRDNPDYVRIRDK